MNNYLKKSVSNGNANEQALIRGWWSEKKASAGVLVWEYYLEGRFADAILFPNSCEKDGEYPGTNTSKKFPLKGEEVVLCEAKLKLTPEVVGQALVYTNFAVAAGAKVLYASSNKYRL